MTDTPEPFPLDAIGVLVPLWVCQFMQPLVATPLDDGVHWRIVESFTFESAVLDCILVVPAGFITDFASIPRELWSVIGGPTGKYTRAACLHDFLYDTPTVVCTREQADHVLDEAMKLCGVDRVQRFLILEGVRLAGERYFVLRTV